MDSEPSGDSSSRDGFAAEARPTMVGHVHLKVRDLDRALAFYRDLLGLELTERHNRFAFCSFGDRHHDVALQEVGPDADGPGEGVGLYHVAFEVDSPDALATIDQRLRDHDVDVSPVDHGISQALYFRDPDGNGIEIYRDTRHETGHQRWQGQNERFDPQNQI